MLYYNMEKNIEKYLYVIEEEFTFNEPTKYRLKCKELFKLPFIKGFYFNRMENYIDIKNRYCHKHDCFITESIEEIKKFKEWCEELDKMNLWKII